MKSFTGPPVIGDNFFDRDRELQILERRVRDGNHILLTGQRRMGKTSIARELGRRLEDKGLGPRYQCRVFSTASAEGLVGVAFPQSHISRKAPF